MDELFQKETIKKIAILLFLCDTGSEFNCTGETKMNNPEQKERKASPLEVKLKKMVHIMEKFQNLLENDNDKYMNNEWKQLLSELRSV